MHFIVQIFSFALNTVEYWEIIPFDVVPETQSKESDFQ